MNTVKLTLIGLTILVILLSMYAVAATAVLVDDYTRPAAQVTAQIGAEQFSIQLTEQAK